ncbi:hypothetical protein SAMN05443549_105277 [Flavobacterium fluvii]|uniref:Uncharacterized protein n=1 Tax=Flavobacterium fluvii TaxID=468056 RepID=A0A1M5LNG6_9FLAO|nr:hypothetical protein SAMN05443549_105277 [Flavobacterium fluvii]
MEGFIFMDDEVIPVYYVLSELGVDFIRCCSVKY